MPATRSHGIFDKHPVISTILLMLFSFTMTQFASAVLIGIAAVFLRGYSLYELSFIGAVITSAIVLILYKIWFMPEFKGILFTGGFLRGLCLAGVMPVFWLLIGLPDALNGNFPHTFSLATVSVALTAGVGEEITFRGLPVSYLKRQYLQEKHILPIVLVTAFCFGLTHGLNILLGAAVSSCLLQVGVTICLGIFLGSVFIRTGNIAVPILLHTLHDLFVLGYSDPEELAVVATEPATLGDLYLLAASLLLAAAGFFLIRKSKRSEICRLWAEKWSQNAPEIPVSAIENYKTEESL